MVSTHPIREYIEKQSPKITQRELAKKLGISEKHLSYIINDHAGVSLELGLRIKEETGIEIASLMRTVRTA